MSKSEAMSFTLLGDDRLPLYCRLAEHLREAIARQQWMPGGRLPAESEIAAGLGVAVGTVRKAISDLVKEGLLVRLQGKGTFVRKPTFDSSLFRFWHFCDEDGNRTPPQSRILACRPALPPLHVRAALGLRAGKEAIFISRLRLWNDRPVVAEEIWLPYEEFSPLLKLKAEDFGDLLYPMYEEACGKHVARAEERLTAQSATAAQAKKVGIGTGIPLIVIERLARGYDNAPLEWRKFWGRASCFQYQIQVN